MTNAKKILITTESREFLIMRRSASPPPPRICRICLTKNCGVTLDDAAVYAGLSAMELIPWIASGAIHANETAGGQLLICQKSLEILNHGEKS